MSEKRLLRLTSRPRLELRSPDCGACAVEVDHDGDGWVCPSCGSYWPTNADDWELGELNEEADGLEVSVDDAWMIGGLDYEDQVKRLARLTEHTPN